MKAERLLEAFHRLGDGPEAVRQFRKLVVGLAISGKLSVSNGPINDPSSFLKQLEARKHFLIAQGMTPKKSRLAELTLEDLPKGFTEPSNFVRLGEISRIEKGQTGIMNAKPGAYPLVVTAEQRGTCDHYDFDSAAAIVPLVSSAGHGKASLHRLHYQEGKFALGSILAAILPYAPDLISARFIFEYLTAFKEELLVSQMIGTANVSLSVGKVSDVPVPLVPPSVQHKVDELMGLCDRLESARVAREATRDRLAAASLARLSSPDPKTFQKDSRFVLDALPELTARSGQIKALRQTILNVAVRGKLAQQDVRDQPASALLQQIAQKKHELLKERGPKDSRPLPVVDPDDEPFSLPRNWVWARAQDLSLKISDGVHKKPDYVKSGVPFITVKNLTEGPGISFRETKFIAESDHTEFIKRTHPEKGDLLITKDGTIGVARIIETDHTFSIFVSVALVKMVFAEIAPFLALCINSDVVRSTIIPKGAALQHLHLVDLRKLPLPLPPLAEQHRIVAKVDELMILCDQLEACLTTSNYTGFRLLDTLITEAVKPADAQQQQAAE